MIYLYESTITDFIYNGQPFPKAYEVTVDRTINDEFFVTGKHPLDENNRYKLIQKDKIIKAHTPDGMQPFRIMDVNRNLGYVEFEAWPLLYSDLRNKLVKPFKTTNLSGQSVLNTFINNLLLETKFSFTSNVLTTHNFDVRDEIEAEQDPNQLYDALEVLKRIVNRWSGELIINGYDIRMVSRIGKDTDALLYEKKNITNFVDKESIQGIVTRVHGKSEWTEDVKGGKQVTKRIMTTVDSPLINSYSGIVFEQQFTNNDLRTEQELKNWLTLKFSTENIDKPSRTIDLDTNIVDGTEIALGDKLNLKYLKHDVDMQIRMTQYQYDGFNNRYIKVYVGDAEEHFTGSLQNSISIIETNIKNSVDKTITSVIVNQLGQKIIYSELEPEGNFREGDVWFDNNGGMFIWDEESANWIPHPFNNRVDAIGQEVTEVIEQADLDRIKAEQDINQALLDAKNYTEVKAQEFDNQLLIVNQNLVTAKNSANAAVLKADKAIEDVGFLKPDVATAKANAATAIQDATTATKNATTAIQNAQTALKSVATLSQEVDVSITSINGELTRKVSQTTFNTLSGTVGTHTTQISQTQNALLAKAESSLVNTIKGTVDTHTTQIKVASDGLELKADSSLVNTVKGTVDSHSSFISANAQAINARLTSTQIETLLTGKQYVNQTTLNATSSGLTAQITQVSTDLSNLEIGGRNLVIRTNEIVNRYLIGTETYPNTSVNSTKNNTMNGLIPVTVGETLTFTKKTVSNGDNFWRVSWLNASNVFVSRVASSDNKFKLVVPSGVSSLWVSYPSESFPKVERGNVATEYTPAPEDMATLEKVVTIEANIDGINTLVASKASQTQVTQLAGQIQTKVESAAYNSKMTQLDSAINLRVVQSDVTAAILADKTIKDTRSDNQLPSWYNSAYPKQTVEEFKYRTTMGVAGTATYGKLETKVIWNSTSGGAITQIFSSSDGMFQRVSNANYTAWLAWDKIAEAGQLINQINISTEGILLQGKRIQLDGDVTMTAAFVTRLDVLTLSAVYADIATLKTRVLTANVITADMFQTNVSIINKLFATDTMVTTLTAKTAFINSVKAIDIAADRITAGTLNASNVNIVGLNVNNLVGNITSFVQSNWNQNGSDVRITSGGIVSTAANGAQTLLQNGVLYVKTASQGLGTIGAALDGNENLFTIDIVNNQSFTIRYQTTTGVNSTYRDIIGYYDYLNTVVINNATQINGWLRMNGALDMQQSDILAARYVTSGVFQTGSIGSILNDGNRIAMKGVSGVSLGVGGQVNGGFSRILWLDGGYIYAEKTLSMQGNSITNNSDRRMKKNIYKAQEDSLSAISRWTFVDYEWISPDKPAGRQFGLIAQDTPELAIYDQERDVYSIDSSRQMMMNSHAINQLNSKVVSMETVIDASNRLAIQAMGNSNSALSETEKLKIRVSELEQKIKQMESAA